MSHKLSLSSVILINLNVMVGAGVFINTVLLSQNAGGLGTLAYAVGGILLLPLVMSMYHLAKIHRGGNFYDYGLHMGRYIGFLTMASYFMAKLASCSLAIHVCISLLQTIFPGLRSIPTLVLDGCMLAIFTILNMLHLRTGKRIQIFFMSCKFVPILFVIFAGLYLFNPGYLSADYLYPSGIITSVPFILYAFMGFEVSCSLSRSIQDPEKNGPRAMLISYFLGIGLVCLFQFMFYGSLGYHFEQLSSYLQAYPALLGILNFSPFAQVAWKILLHLGIASSALGAAYGIMYSNAWNLFELAMQGHVVKKDFFTRLNVHQIPVACVLAEAFIVICYLFFSQGNQIPLQQIASFGSTIAYTLSALALVVGIYRQENTFKLMPILGVISCCLLIGSIIKNALVYGIVPFIAFLAILLVSSLMVDSSSNFKSHQGKQT